MYYLGRQTNRQTDGMLWEGAQKKVSGRKELFSKKTRKNNLIIIKTL